MTIRLITRRSQVQILSPPPKKAQVKDLGFRRSPASTGPFVHGFVNENPRACQRWSPTSSSIQQ